MIKFNNNKTILQNNDFQNIIDKWIPNIDLTFLKIIYTTFSNNLTELLKGFYQNILHIDEIAVESDLSLVSLTSLSNENIEVRK